MKCFLLMLVTLLLLEVTHGKPSVFEDFFKNIPEQMKKAWTKLMTVIREPLKLKRLGSIGKRKTTKRVARSYSSTTAIPVTRVNPTLQNFEVTSMMSHWKRESTPRKYPIVKNGDFILKIPKAPVEAKHGEFTPTLHTKSKVNIPVLDNPHKTVFKGNMEQQYVNITAVINKDLSKTIAVTDAPWSPPTRKIKKSKVVLLI